MKNIVAFHENILSDAMPDLDAIIRGLLCVWIFALPFTGLLFIMRNGFIILMVLLAAWCVVNRRHFFLRTPIDLAFLAFVTWVAFTLPFAMSPAYSLKEFGKLLQQVLVFYAVIYFFRDKVARMRLVFILVGGLALVSAYGLTQIDVHNPQAMTSFLSSEVWLTSYLILIAPLCLALLFFEDRPWIKCLYMAGSGLAMVCLLFTQSRAGLIAMFFQLWSFAWLLRRKTTVILASVFTVVLLTALILAIRIDSTFEGRQQSQLRTSIPLKTSLASLVHRIDIWSFTLAEISKHALVGIGYGKETYKLLYGDEPEVEQQPEQKQQGHLPIKKSGVHNILLDLALQVGVPGLLLFSWLALQIVRTILQAFRHKADSLSQGILLGVVAGILGMGVRLMFDHLLVGSLAILFWVLIAVAFIHVHEQGRLERMDGS